MEYESGGDGSNPIFRSMLQEVAAHAHGGLILFMTDALRDYLQMEATLKKLPEHIRLSEEEKCRFDGMFQAIKGVRKEFIKNYVHT